MSGEHLQDHWYCFCNAVIVRFQCKIINLTENFGTPLTSSEKLSQNKWLAFICIWCNYPIDNEHSPTCTQSVRDNAEILELKINEPHSERTC